MSFYLHGLSAVRAGRTILKPTHLTIGLGERVALVGASGSGKSTLGHGMADTLRRHGRSVAHVPQSPDEALDPLRSLHFHWREAEQALGVKPDADRQRGLLAAMGLAEADLSARPWVWSRGMQQRFVIALALIGTPELLILDEPTSALDPVIAAATVEQIEAHIRANGTALVLITHDLGLAARRADRIIVIDNGQIVEDAATATLIERPVSPAARALVTHRNWAVLPC
ncbi:MAG: ATP-binding cassette domain-containing protein [Phyllobacteriaceae bacterium]|nr:ATP-binding cassette domain-containing protein [Phyllobacteriaceae bacterium]